MTVNNPVSFVLITDHPSLTGCILEFETLPRIHDVITVVIEDETVRLAVQEVEHICRYNSVNDCWDTYYPQVKAKLISG